MLNNDRNNDFNLKDFFSFINRHKNSIIFIVLISLFISLYYTFTISPIYKSSVSLMIKETDIRQYDTSVHSWDRNKYFEVF